MVDATNCILFRMLDEVEADLEEAQKNMDMTKRQLSKFLKTSDNFLLNVVIVLSIVLIVLVILVIFT